MRSIWNQSALLPRFPALESHLQADTVIIGSGMAGILTAHLLQQEGQNVVVVEANRIAGGQTSGTTAKLTAQHGLKYSQLLREFGAETAGQYARMNLAAVEQLRQLVSEQHIDCDFEDCTTYLYSTSGAAALQEEYDACRTLGMEVCLTEDTELPVPAQALGLRHQARFHPLKLLAALAEPLTIFEHSRVLEVEEQLVRTQQGSITANTIIFACHYPFVNVPGYYFARQHQERSYVLALENAEPFQDCYLGIDDGLSFRSWGNTLLLGGSGHRTGENRKGGQYAALEAIAKRYWPHRRILCRWSAQDCIPMDGIPYIGRYAESHPHWLVATGFQKWGMSTSMAAAEILRDLALGRAPHSDSAVFSPQRFSLHASAAQLTDDSLHTLKGLGRRILAPGRIPAEQLPVGHGGVVELDGEKLGVYRSPRGELLAVSVKCPHLGCQLEWNPEEKSWDCPCHGSRFDVHGQLLNGPAQTDL